MMRLIKVAASLFSVITFVACSGEVDVDSPVAGDNSENRVPVADFTYEISGSTLYLNAGKSSDPDGDALTYIWYLGNGQESNDIAATVSYDTMGRKTVHLVVSDGRVTTSKTQFFDVDVSMVPHAVVPQASPVPTASPIVDEKLTRGRNLYQSISQGCQTCHGPDGQLATFKAIDPELEFYTHSSSGDAQYTLEEYITAWMPVHNVNACVGTCASDIAYYIRSWQDGFVPSPAPSPEPEPTVMPEPTAMPSPNPVNQAPVANASRSSNLSGTAALTVNFDGSASTDDSGIAEYRWQFGDGSADGLGAQVQHTYSQVGTYTATLTVRDAQGLSHSSSVNVQVNEGSQTPAARADVRFVGKSVPGISPIASGVAPLLAVVEEGAQINLLDAQYVDIEVIPRNFSSAVASVTMTLSGGASRTRTERAAGFFISGDDGNFDRNADQLPTGSYQLVVSVADVDNTVMLSRTLNFSLVAPQRVNQAPVANASRSTNLTGTAPLTVSFNGSASTDDLAVTRYVWNFGDGSANAEGATVQHTYNNAGTYLPTLTVYDAEGFNHSTQLTVTVSAAQPTFNAATFFAQNCAACHGVDGSGVLGEATRLAGKSFTRADLAAEVAQMPSNAPACNGVAGCVDGLTDYIFANFASEINGPDEGLSCEVQDGLLAPKLRRLTTAQFRNTVGTVFTANFSSITWPAFGDSIPTLGMSNDADALRVDTINIESVYSAVDAIVDRAILGDSRVNSCANATANTCVNTLLTDLGPLLWRRPLTNTERTDINTGLTNLRNGSATNVQQIEYVLKALLLSSNFLYRHELGALANGVRNLSHYEIASLLSYALWDSPPDSTLYTLAANGQLQDAAIVEQQVTRMIADDRFSAVLVSFYKDYLKLDRVLTVQKLQELNFSDTIRQALLRSVELSLGDNVDNLNQGLTAPLAHSSYYVNNSTAPLFGLQASGFTSSLTATAVSSGERSGVLTHPAFLAVHSKEGASGIVKRGVFVLKQMLCLEFGDPPDELTEAPLPEGIDPATTTTRELLHLQHSSQPVCATCHVRIDPAGYGFENYDALGQFRLFEKEIVPINAAGSLSLDSGSISFEDGVDYTEALMDTAEMQACMSRRFLEYMVGQSVNKNACELAKLNQYEQANGSNINTIIRGLMQLESVRKREN